MSNQAGISSLVCLFVCWVPNASIPGLRSIIHNFAGVTGCCVNLGMFIKRYLWFSMLGLVILSTTVSSDFHWAFSNTFHEKIIFQNWCSCKFNVHRKDRLRTQKLKSNYPALMHQSWFSWQWSFQIPQFQSLSIIKKKKKCQFLVLGRDAQKAYIALWKLNWLLNPPVVTHFGFLLKGTKVLLGSFS